MYNNWWKVIELPRENRWCYVEENHRQTRSRRQRQRWRSVDLTGSYRLQERLPCRRTTTVKLSQQQHHHYYCIQTKGTVSLSLYDNIKAFTTTTTTTTKNIQTIGTVSLSSYDNSNAYATTTNTTTTTSSGSVVDCAATQRLPSDSSNTVVVVPRQSCAGCGRDIVERFLLRAIDRYWHTACLRCSQCQAALADLGSTCFTRAGMTLCRNDYIR